MTTYFIHGFLENHNMWDWINIPPSMHPVFLEIPGHGNKLNESCPFTMLEIAKQLGPEITASEFQIIGHSMGGYLIGSLLELGYRPKKIGLFHSKLGDDNEEKKAQRQRAIALVKENHALYVRTMISNLFSSFSKERLHQEIEHLIGQAQLISIPTIIHCQQAMMTRTSAWELAKSLKIPTYYFAGGEDQSIPLSQIQHEVEHLYPIADLQAHSKLGHMGQWESPQLVSDWLIQHFSS
jgi:pimeloyl-ACP methyl ester carboxylesterase